MGFIANQDDQQAFLESLERGVPCPVEAQCGGRGVDVRAAFGGGVYEPPLGAMYGDMTRAGLDPAALVVRLAQYGCGPALQGLADAEPGCFDLRPFAAEDGGGAQSLIGAALDGYWRLSEQFGGGDALADQYAVAVVALLAGGASRHVVNGVSLWAAWPVVWRVWQRSGVRLEGWASAAYEARAWAAAGAVADAEAAAIEMALADVEALA